VGKRFRLITNREKIIRLRIDNLAKAYKRLTPRLSKAECKTEARRKVHRGAKHVRPLCNICEEKVHKVTIDRGKKIAEEASIPRFDLIGHWCDECLHFFYVTPPLNREECEHKKRRVTIDRGKVISEEAGVPRFDLIGHWCDECKRFDQTKVRRVIIQRVA